MRRVAGLAITLAILVGHAALAQGPDITGAWSFQTGTPGGPQLTTVLLQQDGGFVKVLRLPSGTPLRFWGHWRGSPAGAGQIRIEVHYEGMRPLTSCVEIPGFGQKCEPWRHPQDENNVFTITSPSTMESSGIVLMRDPQAALLQVAIPDPSVVMGQAPMQPNIRQPVMPPQARYQTPNDPRKQYEQGNSAFLNGYMRGCVQDQYGRWVGCQQ